mgnify:CR=1 FL=1
MKNILLSCFLFILSSVYAQYEWTEASLYLKNGTELVGLAMIRKEAASSPFTGKEKVFFKLSKESSKTKYKSKEIDSVRFKDIGLYTYIPITPFHDKLMKVVSNKGRAQLFSFLVIVWYYHGDHSANTIMEEYTGYYIQIEGEPYAFYIDPKRQDTHFRNKSSILFEDCPNIIQKLRAEAYNLRDIKTIVEDYNHCDLVPVKKKMKRSWLAF